jgi:hypothetical protein
MTTTPDSPASQLRAAASLMRERAQAAVPGPWAALDGGVMSLADETLWPVSSASIPGHAKDRATRVHIASWQPSAALAAAALLDVVAAETEERASAWQDACPCVAVDHYHEAAALARAYLGEAERAVRAQTGETGG